MLATAIPSSAIDALQRFLGDPDPRVRKVGWRSSAEGNLNRSPLKPPLHCRCTAASHSCRQRWMVCWPCCSSGMCLCRSACTARSCRAFRTTTRKCARSLCSWSRTCGRRPAPGPCPVATALIHVLSWIPPRSLLAHLHGDHMLPAVGQRLRDDAFVNVCDRVNDASVAVRSQVHAWAIRERCAPHH